jgi:hypothetical protein
MRLDEHERHGTPVYRCSSETLTPHNLKENQVVKVRNLLRTRSVSRARMATTIAYRRVDTCNSCIRYNAAYECLDREEYLL